MIRINKLIANSIVITTGPVVKRETHIKFVDGTEGDYLLEGDVDWRYLVEKGLVEQAGGPPTWIKQPQEVIIGTAMTNIGSSAFWGCTSLTSVIIPDNVMLNGPSNFYNCVILMNATFIGRTKSTVRSMSGYSWYFPSGCVIHCTDGDIVIE